MGLSHRSINSTTAIMFWSTTFSFLAPDLIMVRGGLKGASPGGRDTLLRLNIQVHHMQKLLNFNLPPTCQFIALPLSTLLRIFKFLEFNTRVLGTDTRKFSSARKTPQHSEEIYNPRL